MASQINVTLWSPDLVNAPKSCLYNTHNSCQEINMRLMSSLPVMWPGCSLATEAVTGALTSVPSGISWSLCCSFLLDKWLLVTTHSLEVTSWNMSVQHFDWQCTRHCRKASTVHCSSDHAWWELANQMPGSADTPYHRVDFLIHRHDGTKQQNMILHQSFIMYKSGIVHKVITYTCMAEHCCTLYWSVQFVLKTPLLRIFKTKVHKNWENIEEPLSYQK